MNRPATRYKRLVFYTGGAVFKLKRWPYVLFVLRLKDTAFNRDFVKGWHPS